MPTFEPSSEMPADQAASLKAARKHLTEPAGEFTTPKWGNGLMERLKMDGGPKILKLSRNYIHIDYTRFIEVCGEVKGLSLDEALLQLSWNRKQISTHFKEGLQEFIVKAQEHGLNLEKTYIGISQANPADAYIKNSSHGLSQKFVKKYLRGRGRYGATPHPKTARLEVILQEREKRFVMREQDPLEWVRVRLRDVKKEGTQTASQICEEMKMKRLVKAVFC